MKKQWDCPTAKKLSTLCGSVQSIRQCVYGGQMHSLCVAVHIKACSCHSIDNSLSRSDENQEERPGEGEPKDGENDCETSDVLNNDPSQYLQVDTDKPKQECVRES